MMKTSNLRFEKVCPSIEELSVVPKTNVSCPLPGCSKLFYSSATLRLHKAKVHGIDKVMSPLHIHYRFFFSSLLSPLFLAISSSAFPLFIHSLFSFILSLFLISCVSFQQCFAMYYTACSTMKDKCSESIELFVISASAPQLVYQMVLYMLSCLWDGHIKRPLAANQK